MYEKADYKHFYFDCNTSIEFSTDVLIVLINTFK